MKNKKKKSHRGSRKLQLPYLSFSPNVFAEMLKSSSRYFTLSSFVLNFVSSYLFRFSSCYYINRLIFNFKITVHTYKKQSDMIDNSSEMLTHSDTFLLSPVGCGLSYPSLIFGPIENCSPHIFFLQCKLKKFIKLHQRSVTLSDSREKSNCPVDWSHEHLPYISGTLTFFFYSWSLCWILIFLR